LFVCLNGNQVATTFKIDKWTLTNVKGLGLELCQRIGAPFQKSLLKQAQAAQQSRSSTETSKLSRTSSAPTENLGGLGLEVLFQGSSPLHSYRNDAKKL
jgi:hypothetical protein